VESPRHEDLEEVPFTLSHPAAAVPLRRPLRRLGVLSALVIGSMAPDLEYVVPLHLERNVTHSLLALLWYCLPAGLLSYLLFHVLLKGPLLGLMPESALSRLGSYARRYRSLPSVGWGAVIVSLLCGAVTHLAWDSLTHGRGAAVQALPVLRVDLFQFGAFPVFVYTLLQHVSTVTGLVLLAWWSRRWLRSAPVDATPLPVTLSPRHRVAIIMAILGAAAAVGVGAGAPALRPPLGVIALQSFAGAAVFAGLPALALALVIYGLGWHLRAAQGGSAAARLR
jgi:hypothetical protein